MIKNIKASLIVHNNYKNNCYEFKKRKNHKYMENITNDKIYLRNTYKKCNENIKINDDTIIYNTDNDNTDDNTDDDTKNNNLDILYKKKYNEKNDNIKNTKWVIHKFGGSSISTKENMERCIHIIKKEFIKDKNIVVVISALGKSDTVLLKTTDLLITMVNMARIKNTKWLQILKTIEYRHIEFAKKLLDENSNEYTKFHLLLSTDLNDIKDMIYAILLTGDSEKIYERIIGYGELWSTYLFNLRCTQMNIDTIFMDTRDIIQIDNDNNVYEDLSRYNIINWFHLNPNNNIIIATGFIASLLNKQPTTLKRDGSDYTATILGNLLYSKSVTIWSDVDGIYSADPNIVKNAKIIKNLTYHEACELAYFGAKIIHPLTTVPVIKYNIPILIKNTFNLHSEGSIISDIIHNDNDTKHNDDNDHNNDYIKGITTIHNVSLIIIEGNSKIGVCGITSNIFNILKKIGVTVKMITQSSSDYSISFVIKTEDCDKTLHEIDNSYELLYNKKINIKYIHNCSILAVIGNNLFHKKGIAAQIMKAISDVQILMISYGSSEYNITILVHEDDCNKSLNSIHTEIFNV